MVLVLVAALDGANGLHDGCVGGCNIGNGNDDVATVGAGDRGDGSRKGCWRDGGAYNDVGLIPGAGEAMRGGAGGSRACA